jgi:hypothetical protein
VTSVEAPISHSIAAYAAQLTHDFVAAERDRNDVISRAVRDEDSRRAHAPIWQRPATRKSDYSAEEITVCEPEPQRHAGPGREAAYGHAPGIHSAAGESKP